MPERNPMTAVGDTITIDLQSDGGGAVAAQHGAAAHASGTTVLEATVNEVDWDTPVRLKRPVGNAAVDSLVGPSQSGWADLPGYKKARLRCTVLAAGSIPARLNQL